MPKFTQEIARRYNERILLQDAATDEHRVGLRNIDHDTNSKFMKESKTL